MGYNAYKGDRAGDHPAQYPDFIVGLFVVDSKM